MKMMQYEMLIISEKLKPIIGIQKLCEALLA